MDRAERFLERLQGIEFFLVDRRGIVGDQGGRIDAGQGHVLGSRGAERRIVDVRAGPYQSGDRHDQHAQYYERRRDLPQGIVARVLQRCALPDRGLVGSHLVHVSAGRDQAAPACIAVADEAPDDPDQEVRDEHVTNGDMDGFQVDLGLNSFDADVPLEQHEQAEKNQQDDRGEIDPVKQPYRQIPDLVFINLSCLHG